MKKKTIYVSLLASMSVFKIWRIVGLYIYFRMLDLENKHSLFHMSKIFRLLLLSDTATL